MFYFYRGECKKLVVTKGKDKYGVVVIANKYNSLRNLTENTEFSEISDVLSLRKGYTQVRRTQYDPCETKTK